MRVPDDRPAPSPVDRLRVVVVDDEPQIRELVSEALRREGYDVRAFADGHEALAAVEAAPPSLVLTDLKMPRMNGLELIRAVRERIPGVGSILITAYASTETAVQALRYGADDYLTKPFGLEDLRATVSRVLDARTLARHEREAVVRVREEASTLRRSAQRTEAALAEAQESLRLSRSDLERRVRDLELVHELAQLLARKDDLERMLETTAGVLSRRFDAHLARIELELPGGVHVAEHVGTIEPVQALAGMGQGLVRRASASASGIVRDLVLGFGRPLEGLAASVTVDGRFAGGITILRPSTNGHEEDEQLLRLVVPSLATAIEAELNRRRAQDAALGVALGMLDELESRGALFAGHATRVTRLASRMADTLGLSPRVKHAVETAARLHDVGEVGIPTSVLQRDGPLSDRERTLIRSHPVIGAKILAPFGEVASFVRHHHERPDGRGYPDGLSGAAIPLGAGILGVAEAFDAMTSSRPYRRSRSRQEALDEISALRGEQFAPEAVDALLAL
jgi:response regulator RpfG family c-di-GMP phosphodiesterase